MLIGLCQYYENDPAAQTTLSQIPDMTGTQLCLRDYLLGRMAQKRGDLGRAFAFYARSARGRRTSSPASTTACGSASSTATRAARR